MTPAAARSFVRKVLATHRDVGDVSILPGSGDRVVQVMVNFERMTLWTTTRLEMLNSTLREYGFTVRAEPSGQSLVPGLPDLQQVGIRHRGPSFILTR